jgi:triacylglycerol esterase/lipase EstA (alpha/beta hydrolase family)
MPSARSTVAQIQQVTTLGLLGVVAVWVAWHWHTATGVAVVGAVSISFGFSFLLGLEFLALRVVNRQDPAPLASPAELVSAWGRETIHALRVFGWRQPFGWDAVPDFLGPEASVGNRRGIVFIHGFVCNRGFWTPWMKLLRRSGNPFVAVNLEPVFASIDDHADTIGAAIDAVTHASGLPPMLVCHSMGGLAARAWLRAGGQATQVHRIVTIGSPHGGTWLARFSHARNGMQMAQGSEWVVTLAQDLQRLPQPPFTCWYSNCDNVVFPPSMATLPGADNRLVQGAAHVELGFRSEVIAATLALL